MKISPIIEVDELLKIYKNADVLIFDTSNAKNTKINYESQHLEGAFFVDINTQLADIQVDLANGGRHPLPTTEKFSKTLTDLGISKENHIIIYDDKYGSNASARFWWMLKSAGHQKVQVLNGGFHQAKKHNFPLSSGLETIKKPLKQYTIDQWILPTIEIEALKKVSQNSEYRVIDVREKDRFNGVFEPIDLIAGHIPGAINIPFTENLDENGLFLQPHELKKKYTLKFGKIKPENRIVHCGSGVTACHTLLAITVAEMEMPVLYVGSWSEWSRNESCL